MGQLGCARSQYMSVCSSGKGRGATPVHAGWQGNHPHKTWPHRTHLSNVSRGDLPLVGASEGTGNIPVKKEEECISVPSANRRAGDHLTHIPGEPTVNMKWSRRPSAG